MKKLHVLTCKTKNSLGQIVFKVIEVFPGHHKETPEHHVNLLTKDGSHIDGEIMTKTVKIKKWGKK